jgi:hypothetical protein
LRRRASRWIDVFCEAMMHPSSHFFVGGGPFLFHQLFDKDEHNAENDATNLGVSLVLGGRFSALAPHAPRLASIQRGPAYFALGTQHRCEVRGRAASAHPSAGISPPAAVGVNRAGPPLSFGI